MPSKKILIVLIICVAALLSTLILQKNVGKISNNLKLSGVDTGNIRENVTLGYDWKKILIENSSSTTTFINYENPGVYDDTTMTSEVAKNFFSQYLLLKKDGKTLSQNDALTIAKQTISSPEYAKLQGAQYNIKNLHVTATNKTTITDYNNALAKISGIWLTHKIGEEFTITNKALNTKNEVELAKLDPIIADYKRIISLLLDMQVPSDATQIHLELLNNTSNVLFSTESMRASFNDPIKGILGMDRYAGYMQNLAKSIKKIELYFDVKNLK